MWDALTAWLIKELQDPVKAAGGMLGSALTFVVVVVLRAVFAERKRSAEEASKVGATVVHVPSRPSTGTVIATARQIWELEQRVQELQAIADDSTRTAQALAESHRREEALKEENAELRMAIDIARGPASLPPRVVEVDDRPIEDKPTPTQGRARVRR